MTDVWIESQATWINASDVYARDEAGAKGRDRGPELAEAQPEVSETTLVITPQQFSELVLWKSGTRLSVVVEGDAKQVVCSRENSCDDASAPRLEVLSC